MLAGLEVARCLDAGRHRLEHAFEVINFTCEEPSDFGLSTIGSRAMSGKLDAATAARLRDRRGEASPRRSTRWAAAGRRSTRRDGRPSDVLRYLELHIEQAVSLDRAGLPLGVVTAIAAPSRYRVAVRGRQDHAGGTPMADRRDAVAAAAELVLLVERLAREAGRGMVGTVGVIEARPNMINVVPGEADLLVDFRGIDPAAIAETLGRFEAGTAEIAARRRVAVEWTSLMRDAPLTVAPEMVAAVEAAARRPRRPASAPHERRQPRREPRGEPLPDRARLHPVPRRPQSLPRGVGRGRRTSRPPPGFSWRSSSASIGISPERARRGAPRVAPWRRRGARRPRRAARLASSARTARSE